MKGSLGLLAVFIGLLLLISGICVFVMAIWVIDPTIAGGGEDGYALVAFLGFSAASVGSLLCLAACASWRSDKK